MGLLIVVMVCFTFAGCDESLPPREEPRKYIQMSMDMFPKDHIPIGPKTWQNLRFTLTLRNIYDEVLEDTARIRGTVEIWMLKDPTVHATIVGGVHDLVGGVLPHGGVLTLKPDSAVIMNVEWNHFTDRNLIIWWYVKEEIAVDALGRVFRRSEPIEFGVRASLQVFNNVQALTTSTVITTVYWVYTTGRGPYEVELFPINNFSGKGYPSRLVKLRWDTSLEIKNYGFLVQRRLASDTSAFVTVPHGFVPGFGTTGSFHSYTFYDTVTALGTWSYRLEQMADLFETNRPIVNEAGPIDVPVP